jgi:hypothetical protein
MTIKCGVLCIVHLSIICFCSILKKLFCNEYCVESQDCVNEICSKENYPKIFATSYETQISEKKFAVIFP